MQAMNMTVVQVINVHLTPPPTITEGGEGLSHAAATESFTQGSSDQQPFDQSNLPTYFSNCNGCSIYSANSISTTQTVNLTMPNGFESTYNGVEQFVQDSMASDEFADVNECNQCAVFNAIELHTIQIINCINQ